MKENIIKFINKLPYIRGLVKELNNFKYINRFEMGHYHSPIPDDNEVDKHYLILANSIADIDFDFQNQYQQLNEFSIFYNEMPWDFYDDSKNNSFRYKNEKSFYRFSDAIFLYLMMRRYKPKRIIEVGSGYSSAIMLDTNDLFFKGDDIQFTFIEPNPQDRLNGLINESDRNNCTIYIDKVQEVDLNVYLNLQANDILFIDSSHVSKAGSDFNFIMFQILPILKSGVIIHFHDVFYPFEYPKDWLKVERFYWNECYLLRAFLMNNNDYKLLFFNSAAHEFHKDYFEEKMPEVLIDHQHCGAIWIQKK